MDKRLFTLISTIIGALGTIASALVTYFQPPYAVAIVTSIGILVTATTEIMLQFVKSEPVLRDK